jgi:uncharacterized protein YacL
MDILIIILLLFLIAQNHLNKRALGNQGSVSSGNRGVVLDTSALMDGRVLTVAQAGFVPDKFVVLRSVLAELQLLADQADADKRARARHGLDVVSELKAIKGIDVRIFDDKRLTGDVDERLVLIAKRKGYSICTTDFNLNKVAKAMSIDVLNINELAQSIRLAFLPGEQVSILLQQKGQDSHQAVGHLSDGTMVVVERASQKIGTTVEVEFIRSLQTAAGRMMFAKLVQPEAPSKDAERSSKSGRADGRQKVRASAEGGKTIRKQVRKPAPTKRNNKEDDLIQLVNSQRD